MQQDLQLLTGTGIFLTAKRIFFFPTLFFFFFFRRMRTLKEKAPEREGPFSNTQQESSEIMSKILAAVLTIIHLFWTLDNSAFVDFCTSSKREKEYMKWRTESQRTQCNFTVVTVILDHYCSNSQKISLSSQSITQGCPSFSRTEKRNIFSSFVHNVHTL